MPTKTSDYSTSNAHLERYDDLTPYSELPDFELVRLAKAGDLAAFEALVYKTADMAHRVATCILNSPEDARDEVQSAFRIAYSRINLFTGESKFSTWVIRILINRCYMRLRVRRRAPLVTIERRTRDGDRLPYDLTCEHTPEREFGRRQVAYTLRRELNSIPPLLRVPLELHFIYELPVKDVAVELGVSVAATKSRLHRAQLFLRERMLKHVTRRGAASLTAE